MKLSSVILAAAIVSAQAADNILLNPGFEDGTNAWHTTVGNATYTPDSTFTHSGNFSVMGVETNTGSLGRLYQNVTSVLMEGQTYQISGWIKTEGVVGGNGAAIALQYVTSSGAVPADGRITMIGLLTGTADWTYYQSTNFTLPAMPADSTALYFLMDFSAATGTAWFDDLSLTGPTVPIVITGIFTNLTFTSTTNRTFSVMGCTNIMVPVSSWQVLGTATEDSPGNYHFLDINNTNQPLKFYMVR